MKVLNARKRIVTLTRLTTAIFFFLCSASLSAQKINGQWRGYFNSNGDIVLSGGGTTEYVLELELNGTEISGYSYSYFQDRRYYVICSLSGTYYKSTKSMKVTETARIKGFTPQDWSDCLQTHILTYEKEGDLEELAGRWVTATGQVGECGKGLTTLTRRTITKDLSSYNKTTTGTPFSAPKTTEKTPATSIKPGTKPVAKAPVKTPTKPGTTSTAKTPLATTKKPTTPPVAKTTPVKPPLVTTKPIGRDAPAIIVPEKKTTETIIVSLPKNFEKRNNEVLKTIEIGNPTFKVDLYDNGDIDGDSVSLFYNNRLLLSRKRLSDKPISLSLDATTDDNTNELTMYAENLGIIPPNTALMVVTDGDKRYEVRISSDLKKSGTIRFVYRPSASVSVPKTNN